MNPVPGAVSHIELTRGRVNRRGHIREIVFGSQDGVLTSLGLVSGVSGATTGRLSVLVAGLAGGLAGMLAMGAGAYVSAKSEREVLQHEVRLEKLEMEAHPDREADELVELFVADGLGAAEARTVADIIARHPEAMLKSMTQKEMGIAAADARPLQDGILMALSFLLGAVIPIVPWLFVSVAAIVALGPFTPSPALALSVMGAAAMLFVIGFSKGRLAGESAVGGGLQIAAIGLGCALVAYLLGTVVPDALGLHPLATG